MKKKCRLEVAGGRAQSCRTAQECIYIGFANVTHPMAPEGSRLHHKRYRSLRPSMPLSTAMRAEKAEILRAIASREVCIKSALQYASAALQADRDVVLTAVALGARRRRNDLNILTLFTIVSYGRSMSAMVYCCASTATLSLDFLCQHLQQPTQSMRANGSTTAVVRRNNS